MARQDAMAAIDRALNPPPKTEEEQEQETGLASPLPIVEETTPKPKPPKKKQAPTQKSEETRQQEAIEQAFSRSEGTIAEQKTDLSGVQKAYAAFSKIFKKVGDTTTSNIERLPTPGSMAVPLILLLLFFFLLIPINGHTRIVWLWLTLTGNAEISPAQGSQVVGGTFSETIPPAQPQNGTVTLSLPVIGPSFMTGASEDFL